MIRLEENWTEHEISTIHGLSSDVIEAVIQDGTGTFWLGSQMTVDRIDLTAKRPFSYKQKGGLHGYSFRTFAMARDTFLFVGNTTGVFKVNIHLPNAMFEPLGLNSMGGINSLATQGDSLLWIAGAIGLERRSIDGTSSKLNLPLKGVRKLFTSGERLYLLHDETLKFLQFDEPEPSETDINTIPRIGLTTCADFLVLNDTIFWTDGFDVSLTDKAANNTIIKRRGKSGKINKLVVDGPRNQLLLCTTDGLEIWKKEEGEEGIYQRIMHKFKKNNVLTAYVDAAGNLWVSQNRSSLIYVHRPKPEEGLAVLRLPDTLGRGANSTWSVALRKNHLYWGTNRGLFVTRLGMQDSTIKIAGVDERVTVLWLRADTLLLIGTSIETEGKGRLLGLNVNGDDLPTGNKLKEIEQFNAPVRSLAFDRTGNLLVGLSDIGRSDGKPRESLYWKEAGSAKFKTISGFLDRDAYTLKCIDDTMYIGTSNGEVLRLITSGTPKVLETIWQRENDPVLNITRVDNTLLVGTFYGGLHRIEEAPSSTSILPSYYTDLFNAVYYVAGTNKGYYWLATDRGIHRFCLKTMDVNSWDIRHGVQGIDFNKGAYFDPGDGSLFFGGENGLNRVWPDSFSTRNTAYFTAQIAAEMTTPEDWNNLALNIDVKDPTENTPFGILYGFLTDRDSILVTQIFEPDIRLFRPDTIVQRLESFQSMRPTRSGKYKLIVTRYKNGIAYTLPINHPTASETQFYRSINRPWSVWLRANWLFFILPLLILVTIFLYRKNQSVNENLEDTKETLTELKHLFGALIKTWRGSHDKLLLNFRDVLNELDLGKEQVSIIEVTDDGNGGLRQKSHFLLKSSCKIKSKTIEHKNNFCHLCVQKAKQQLDINPYVYPQKAIITEGDIDKNFQQYGFEEKPVSTPEDGTRSFMFLPLVRKVGGRLECIGAISTQDATIDRYASPQVQAMIQVLAEQVGHNVLFHVTFSDVLHELLAIRDTWSGQYPDVEPFHARGGWFTELPPYYSLLVRLFDQAEDALPAWIAPLALQEDDVYPDAHPLNVAVKSIAKASGERSELTITWIVLLLLGSRTRDCKNTEQRLEIYKKEFSSFEALLKSNQGTKDRDLIDGAIRDNPLLCLDTNELINVMNLLVRVFNLLSIDKFNQKPTQLELNIKWDDNLPRLSCRWTFSKTGNVASLKRLHRREAARKDFREVGKVLYDLMDHFRGNIRVVANEATNSLELKFTPDLSYKN
jgi:hypothetical protein